MIHPLLHRGGGADDASSWGTQDGMIRACTVHVLRFGCHAGTPFGRNTGARSMVPPVMLLSRLKESKVIRSKFDWIVLEGFSLRHAQDLQIALGELRCADCQGYLH